MSALTTFRPTAGNWAIQRPHLLAGTMKIIDSTIESINIVGEPRIGKSSFANDLYREMSDKDSLGELNVQVQLEAIGAFDEKSFWHYLIGEIKQATAQAGRHSKAQRTGDYEGFRELVDSYIASGNLRLNILVDDAERILQIDGLGSKLRALVTDQERREHLRFIYISADYLQDLWWRQQTQQMRKAGLTNGPPIVLGSPFENVHLATHIGLLEKVEARDLLNHALSEGSRQCLSTEQVDQVIDEAGRHPYLLKIGAAILIRLQDGLSSSPWSLFFEQWREEFLIDDSVQYLCAKLVDRRSEEGVQALELIAHNELASVDKAVIRLFERIGLVEATDAGKTRLFANAFRYWLRQRARARGISVNDDAISGVDIGINEQTGVASIGGRVCELSPIELKLFLALYENRGSVCRSDVLTLRVWGTTLDSKILRRTVLSLRQKVELDPRDPKLVINRWGEGYLLV